MSKVEYAVKGLAGSQSLREHAGLDLLLKTFDITKHTKNLHVQLRVKTFGIKMPTFFVPYVISKYKI